MVTINHLDEANMLIADIEDENLTVDQRISLAQVHSNLALAEAIKHGLRDVVYEIRD